MKIVYGKDFNEHWKTASHQKEDAAVEKPVREIIEAVRTEGDAAVRRYAAMFDRSSPENLETPLQKIREAVANLDKTEPDLAKALRFSAENIRRFSLKQKEQFMDFEFENLPGVFTGQKIIPVNSAGIYVPGGRYPLISSALMCLIPAFCAGTGEVCFASPPGSDGSPDKRILGTAGIAAEVCGRLEPDPGKNSFRAFSMGGAQAIAALSLGTQTVPRCDMIAGPGNKYVAEAKRYLYGRTGIDFIAGPSDILVITDENSAADIAAADMLAQAEHDPDARVRALVPDAVMAEALIKALNKRLENFSAGDSSSHTKEIAQQSLTGGGLIIIYDKKEEAQRIANAIAPEHLELQVSIPDMWIPELKNYGSLFIGSLSAEVLGDYSSGLNHTLPTFGCSRFTGGLSVRHFLKTVTTLRCERKAGYAGALETAQTIALAEGLSAHAESAKAEVRII